MQTIKVAPLVPERSVPMPEREGAMLPPEGAEVPRTPYWLRMIAKDYVVEVDPAVTMETLAGEPEQEALPVAAPAPKKKSSRSRKEN